MLDYWIQNATIVDGSGAEPFPGEIGIEGDTIAFASHKTRERKEARHVIDAAGRVATPGFIDIHCHSDAVAFYPGKNPKRLLQGFTTEVIGNCGISLAPVGDRLEDLKRYCGPVFSNMPVPYTWKSFGEYLNALERQKPVLNTAAQVGHGTIRIAAIGMADQKAGEETLQTMRDLLAESLDEGAFGMSAGLFYAPGVFASDSEIESLCEILARRGDFYSVHLRSESVGLIRSVQDTLRITEKTGVNTEFSHHKASGRPYFGTVNRTLSLIEEANEKGWDVNCDVYPYITANTQLSSLLPPWALEGGGKALQARLEDPAARAQILRDLKNEGAPYENLYQFAGPDKVLISECSEAALVGKTIGEVARERGEDHYETLLDVIAETDNSAMMIIELMSEADVATVIAGKYSMIGTDGFPSLGKCHPRYTSSFVRVLEKYVKEEHLLTMSEAIHKMTGMPARKVGLKKRGLLRGGYKADLLLLDWERLHDNADYDRFDALADGIDYVWINGIPAVEAGADRHVVAGKVLRSTD